MDIDNKQLERDIENALRARGLKEQMQQWDREAKATKLVGEKKREQKITPWNKLSRTIYSLSAIAAVVALLIVTIPASTWHQTYNQLARWGQQQYAHYFHQPKEPKEHTPVVYQNSIETLMAMAESSVKQIADHYYEQEILGHENLMYEAVWQVLKGKYDVAQSILEEAQQNLSADDADYQSTMDDITYLDALCDLGQNYRSKAIRKLTSIAEGPSKHQQAAETLLKEIK